MMTGPDRLQLEEGDGRQVSSRAREQVRYGE